MSANPNPCTTPWTNGYEASSILEGCSSAVDFRDAHGCHAKRECAAGETLQRTATDFTDNVCTVALRDRHNTVTVEFAVVMSYGSGAGNGITQAVLNEDLQFSPHGHVRFKDPDNVSSFSVVANPATRDQVVEWSNVRTIKQLAKVYHKTYVFTTGLVISPCLKWILYRVPGSNRDWKLLHNRFHDLCFYKWIMTSSHLSDNYPNPVIYENGVMEDDNVMPKSQRIEALQRDLEGSSTQVQSAPARALIEYSLVMTIRKDKQFRYLDPTLPFLNLGKSRLNNVEGAGVWSATMNSNIAPDPAWYHCEVVSPSSCTTPENGYFSETRNVLLKGEKPASDPFLSLLQKMANAKSDGLPAHLAEYAYGYSFLLEEVIENQYAPRNPGSFMTNMAWDITKYGGKVEITICSMQLVGSNIDIRNSEFNMVCDADGRPTAADIVRCDKATEYLDMNELECKPLVLDCGEGARPLNPEVLNTWTDNRTVDNVCCFDDEYLLLNSADGATCRKVTSCQFGASEEADDYNDVTCYRAPCVWNREWYDVEEEKCKRLTVCLPGEMEVNAPSETSDRSCASMSAKKSKLPLIVAIAVTCGVGALWYVLRRRKASAASAASGNAWHVAPQYPQAVYPQTQYPQAAQAPYPQASYPQAPYPHAPYPQQS